MQNFFSYFNRRVWEIIVLTLTCSTLSTCFAEGFFIPDVLMGKFIPALGICFILNVFIYAFSYNRKTAIVGIFSFIFLAVIVCLSLSNGENANILYLIITVLTDLFIYFMTKLRQTTYFILPLGIVIIVCDVILEYGNHLYLFILFVFSSAVLTIIKINFFNMKKNITALYQHHRIALFSALISILCIVLSIISYEFIIKTINPSHYEPQLKTVLMRLPIIEKLGISSHIYLPDPDNQTEQQNENEMLANQDKTEDGTQISNDNVKSNDSENHDQQLPDNKNIGQAVNYLLKDYFYLIIPIVAVLVILSLFLLSKLCRRYNYSKLMKQTKINQIVYIYDRLINVSITCKLTYHGIYTPIEFADTFSANMKALIETADFVEVTKIFEKCFYGNINPSEEEYQLYLDIYNNLFSKIKSYLGFWKYIYVSIKYFLY